MFTASALATYYQIIHLMHQEIAETGESMKVGILAGGLGTRLSEETQARPKPMVEIGGQPILWHIMKSYAARGFSEFVIAAGYRSDVIKDYFANYRIRHSCGSLTVRLNSDEVVFHDKSTEDWTVHIIETGLETQTGGRVRKIGQFVGDEPFMLTYGDGVADLDPNALLSFHRKHGKLATLTAVRPPARFGGLRLEGDSVADFTEKPRVGEGWINGGFLVLEPQVLEYIAGDSTVMEQAPLERLAAQGELTAYRHEGFWQCMDTLRDVRLLNTLWDEGRAPWKVW